MAQLKLGLWKQTSKVISRKRKKIYDKKNRFELGKTKILCFWIQGVNLDVNRDEVQVARPPL